MPPDSKFLLLFLESINKCNNSLLVSNATTINRGSSGSQSYLGLPVLCKGCSETKNTEELVMGLWILTAWLVDGVPSPYQPNFHLSLFWEPVLMNFGITRSSR